MENKIVTNWLVLYTKPKHEKKVFEYLKKLNISCFFPTYTATKQWSDRKKKIISPLFPSTIFVLESDLEIINQNKIDSFKGFLRQNNSFAIVKNYEIENIKILLNQWNGIFLNEDSVTSDEIKKGVNVIVTKGPFENLVGKSIVVNKKHKIVIEIQSLGFNTQIELPKSFVKII